MDVEKIKQAVLKKLMSAGAPEAAPTPVNANDIESIKAQINENESQPIAKVAGLIQHFKPLRQALGMQTKEEDYGVPEGSMNIAEAATEPLADFENKKVALQEFLKKKAEDNVIANAKRVRELKDNPEVIEQHAPQTDEALAAAELRQFAKSLK